MTPLQSCSITSSDRVSDFNRIHLIIYFVIFILFLFIAMLPAPAIFHFPWEISSGAVQEGLSVRMVGKLVSYQPEESMATLSAQHASKEHQVVVHTLFVEPFNPIIGAQYIVLGETENAEEVGVMVRARVLNCVDGVNIALLQKAINEQRSFFKERERKQDDAVQPTHAT